MKFLDIFLLRLERSRLPQLRAALSKELIPAKRDIVCDSTQSEFGDVSQRVHPGVLRHGTYTTLRIHQLFGAESNPYVLTDVEPLLWKTAERFFQQQATINLGVARATQEGHQPGVPLPQRHQVLLEAGARRCPARWLFSWSG